MILLTGASGFIGQHLLKALIGSYGPDHILALTSRPVSGCRYLLHRDYTFDNDYFIASGYQEITTIIHAGAFTPKSGKEANDWEACNSNIISMDTLLKAGFPNVRQILYLSTLDVYGEDHIISEQSPVAPASLYGASKLYGEKMVSAWAASKGKLHQILRIGHVYGPGEEAYQKIIPLTIKKLLYAQPVQIFGTGDELRSFVYIGDIVRAIMQALTLDEHIGVVNLVSSQAVSIRQLVDKLLTLSGVHAEVSTEHASVKGRNWVFDNGKMRQYLLPAETSLDDGLYEEWKYMKRLHTK